METPLANRIQNSEGKLGSYRLNNKVDHYDIDYLQEQAKSITLNSPWHKDVHKQKAFYVVITVLIVLLMLIILQPSFVKRPVDDELVDSGLDFVRIFITLVATGAAVWFVPVLIEKYKA